MSLRVHALLISEIVAPLRTVHRTVRRPDPGDSTDTKTNAGPNSRALSSAERCACNGADRGPDGSTRGAAYVCVFSGSHPTDRFEGVLAALDIIRTELVERFAASREDQHARTARHGCATGKRHKGGDRRSFNGWERIHVDRP